MLFFIFFLAVGVVSADYCDDSLSLHNSYRAKHHSGNLKCNSEISKDAQAYANKLAVNCEFKHSGNNKYGENIYKAGASNAAPDETKCAKDAVVNWYNEEVCYDYDNPGSKACKKTSKCNNCVVGHFTAVVWKATTEVGVGVAKCKSKQNGYFYTIVVANYKPPGNYKGQYPQNVLRP